MLMRRSLAFVMAGLGPTPGTSPGMTKLVGEA